MKILIVGYMLLAPIISTSGQQCTPGSTGCCDNIGFLPPPESSSCWDYWTPPKDGVIIADMPDPPKGCDYQPCQDAVCACDSYCCDIAWDESCRGYSQDPNGPDNNYFVDGCSARILCCESEIPITTTQPPSPAPTTVETVLAPIIVQPNQCTSESDSGCCDNIGAFPPPESSSCWDYWTPPKDGIITADMPDPPLGCDYKPCQDAVCACDSYCCDTAWDESCRGYQQEVESSVQNNYFVDGCSAKILCCESKLNMEVTKVPAASSPVIIVPVPVSSPVPVAVPAPSFQVIEVPSAAPTTYIDPNQCTSESDSGCCDNIGVLPPPKSSSCWDYWTPPKDGIITADMPGPPLGCDHKPCQDAVCACDSYCCDTAWDGSCRGYHPIVESSVQNNYFVDGCSAKILCCESKVNMEVTKVPAASSPDIIVPVPSHVPEAVPAPSFQVIEVPSAAPTTYIDPNQCTSETDSGCCDNIGVLPPPESSSCWDYWTPPKDGIITADMPDPPLGCDYKPCQDAVCACDSYCCDTAWDESCRGYQQEVESSVQNNYFVDGCSAKILCCESKLQTKVPTAVPNLVPVAAPEIPITTAVPTTDPTMKIIQSVQPSSKIIEVPVAVPAEIPVPFLVPQPTPTSKITEIPNTTAVPTTAPSMKVIQVPVALPTEMPVPVLVPQAAPGKFTEVPVAVPTEMPVPVLVPQAAPGKVTEVPVAVPVAVPKEMPVPVLVPQAAPGKVTEVPVAVPVAVPKEMPVPVLVPQAAPGKVTEVPVAVPVAVPTEMPVPVLVPHAALGKVTEVPLAVPVAVPKEMPVPVLVPQAAPGKVTEVPEAVICNCTNKDRKKKSKGKSKGYRTKHMDIGNGSSTSTKLTMGTMVANNCICSSSGKSGGSKDSNGKSKGSRRKPLKV